MGLATAPAIMQSVMREPTKEITHQFPHVTAYVYLDDFLFVAPDPSYLLEISDYMTKIGLNLSKNKSVLEPTQELSYLGVSLNLRDRSLSVPLSPTA